MKIHHRGEVFVFKRGATLTPQYVISRGVVGHFVLLREAMAGRNSARFGT